MSNECLYAVGDKVTVGDNTREVWQIAGLWQEEFRASGVQWVARLRGPRSDMSMRVAHLRLLDKHAEI